MRETALRCFDSAAHHRDVTAENTTIASESLSGEITGKTYETKKIHT